MKKISALIVLMLMVVMTLPVLAASEYETLRLDEEDIVNRLEGNMVVFKLLSGQQPAKKIEIDETALKYMTEKGIKLAVETNAMKLTVTPDAFKTQEWLEAVKSGEPLGIRLFIEKGSATKASDNFDEWYYNQIGLARFGTSTWDLRGEILVGGVKKYDIKSFAAPVIIDAKYPVSAETYAVNTSNLEMYVLNEATEKWDYLGGTVDPENRMMTFNTKVPGLYIILSNQKPKGFTDLKGHWAEGDIQFLIANKVVGNKEGGKFYPDQEITRAEFAGFLVRLLKIADGASVNPFKDIAANHPYYQEIISAAQAGLVQGVTKDSFAPDKKITREEMAVMMTRALKYKNVVVEINEISLTKFTDAGTVSLWAKEGVNTVSSAGLMNGKELNSFAPKSFTTKGEAAAILHRLYNKTS